MGGVDASWLLPRALGRLLFVVRCATRRSVTAERIQGACFHAIEPNHEQLLSSQSSGVFGLALFSSPLSRSHVALASPLAYYRCVI